MIDRLTGVTVILFGAALLFLITPYATETVGYGWLRPNTVPNVMAVIMMLAGTTLALATPQDQYVDFAKMARAAGFLLVIALGLWAMVHWHYRFVAPGLALVLMLLVGERRWPWLLVGAVVLPFAISFLIENVLGRPLL
ncbi:tripartite tricarboxylate transporter TctB family protein [Maritalea mediterranea]|uniref:Tripartite tricarboxylate transporter TctB family protein n=1 Tax=Maritalea mediterranea TaxID=2909667 RepID=A0ABS9E8T5_9HYPH|nr:tripartite tricarboxylate transporter TctB family protein [Maritalea mediterranea]MCF4099282.1 tripartite tricarboxylate transporter TctB family protein [Maritalea mediterranea]